MTYLLMPLRMFEETAMAWTFSKASAKRAAAVLAIRRTTEDGLSHAGAVPGGDLYDPSSGLLAPAGQFTAVVCGDPDAAGVLADRLGGHSPDAAGEPSTRVGGVALDELPLETARRAVLVQDKDPVLLSGTLRELLDVPSSGGVSAERALEAAQCGDVLSVLAQSLRTVARRADGQDRAAENGEAADPMAARLTERGRSLSGGQRQRLALARSLVADPPVLVLDEPTSAVDAHTEARIAQGLRRLREGRTTVVLTSSPLLLDRADRVVFVQDGAAVAAGGHRELLGTDSRYRSVVTRYEPDDGARTSAPRPSASPSPSPSPSTPQAVPSAEPAIEETV
jgi:ABC-type transport system involved in cytochrome bd biosynthesis fused ATPase/permease subunit